MSYSFDIENFNLSSKYDYNCEINPFILKHTQYFRIRSVRLFSCLSDQRLSFKNKLLLLLLFIRSSVHLSVHWLVRFYQNNFINTYHNDIYKTKWLNDLLLKFFQSCMSQMLQNWYKGHLYCEVNTWNIWWELVSPFFYSTVLKHLLVIKKSPYFYYFKYECYL